MVMWNSRLINKAFEPIKQRQRYKTQLYECIKEVHDKEKKIWDYLEIDEVNEVI